MLLGHIEPHLLPVTTVTHLTTSGLTKFGSMAHLVTLASSWSTVETRVETGTVMEILAEL